MLKFTGPAFAQVDNRLMSLQLVQSGLTNAVMFGPDGDVLQPSEVLYKKAILVERGSFRPVTRVNVDMLNCATGAVRAGAGGQGQGGHGADGDHDEQPARRRARSTPRTSSRGSTCSATSASRC